MTKEKVSSVGFSGTKSEELDSSLLSQKDIAFRGNFNHTLDAKGRVSLPSEFRKVLNSHCQDRIVLTNYISDGSRCIEGFALSSWLEFEEKLKSKSRFSSKLQKLENFYLSRSSECSVDTSGRILLPNHLRQYAGIEKEVTFTSSIHGFRVWDTRVWEHIFREAESALLENPDIFADVDI